MFVGNGGGDFLTELARLVPHFAQNDEPSADCVPQFGQNIIKPPDYTYFEVFCFMDIINQELNYEQLY